MVDQADLIINCCAYTNEEKAEVQEQVAYNVNARAVGALCEMAKAGGKQVIHISTDYVFDGTLDRPYVETDETNPLSAYARTKLAGEKMFIESGVEGMIIRLQWTYGKNGTNFVKKIIELGRRGISLKVVDDEIGAVTAATEVAKAIVEMVMMDRLPQGVYHFAASGYASRYEIARFIFDTLKKRVNLKPCKSSEFKTAAARPLNSRFNCQKIQAILSEPIRQWQEPLSRFLADHPK